MQRILANFIFLSCTLWLSGANAANDLVDQVRACTGHQNDNERLACFDKVAAESVSSVVVAAPATVPAIAPVVAPVTAPVIAPAIAPVVANNTQATIPAPQPPTNSAPEPKEFTSKVVSVEPRAYGRWVVTLENSQVWAQNETESRVKLRPGDVVTIKKGAMGSYQLVGSSSSASTYVKRVK